MKFYSKGKLLLTGEYLILKGARGLAVPLKVGQSLQVEKSETNILSWKSTEIGLPWFSAEIEPDSFTVVASTDRTIARKLVTILQNARKLSTAIQEIHHTTILTNTEFALKWGFGSSSALISNIAYWFQVDPFVLHQSVSSGSGYDVITARAGSPLFYTVTESGYKTEPAAFQPPFIGSLYLVYSGNKQKTDISVDKFSKKRKKYKTEAGLISELTGHIAFSANLRDFEYYIAEHEAIIASVLKRKRVKEELFSDFDGEIKSLGAWGGDFLLATWEGSKEEIKSYFSNKGCDTVFAFTELAIYS